MGAFLWFVPHLKNMPQMTLSWEKKMVRSIKGFVGITRIIGCLLEVLDVISAFMSVGREDMGKGLKIKLLSGI